VTIAIPQELRVFSFTELTLVDINDVDVDRLLPRLWELIVTQGREFKSSRDAENYVLYLDKLTADARLDGFADESGKRVLDGWLRSSVVQMGAKGRAKTGTQMAYIYPLTIASYRSGLPRVRRNRNADQLIYHLLAEEIKLRGAEHPAAELRKLLEKAIGDGVEISVPGEWLPTYDGHTKIDVNALLSLYFLEQFEMKAIAAKRDESEDPFLKTVSSAVPSATRGLAADLLDYMTAYGGRLPPAAFVDRFAALVSLRLFQLPLRIARASRHVIATGQQPTDMQDEDSPNPLELYCDFTRLRGSASDELARQCVQRDMEIMRGFLFDRLLLRSLREASDDLDEARREFDRLAIADKLTAMVEIRRHPDVKAYATHQIRLIERATREDTSGTEEDLSFIAGVRDSGTPPIDQLTSILVEGIGEIGLKNQVKWFWNTGGIKKPYGLLSGFVNSRRSWRYAPSDDLLNAILLVCFTRKLERPLSRMKIEELLKILEERFGILIARPPTDFDSADNRAAAASNLDAFKRRLRLLGCFDGLSDDFSAQYVRIPVEMA
jgi:hypothetical protein